MLAGVCAGLARHLNIDVTLVRIVFVVATFLGGAGVIAYVAAVLLVPEEGRDQPLVRSGPQRGRAQFAIGLVLVGLGVAHLVGNIGIGLNESAAWGIVLVAIGAFFLMRTHEGRLSFGDAGGAGNGATGGADVADREGATAAETPSPGGDDATAEMAAGEPATTPLGPAPATSSGATRVVLGGVLVAAGALVAIFSLAGSSVGWETVAGTIVVLAGIGLMAGAFFGASPLLVAPALLAAGAVMALQAADVRLHGGIGDRLYRPAAAADLHERYHLGIGQLQVDLRDTPLPPGRTVVKAEVGMGQLDVRVPRGTAVRIVGHAGAGSLRLLGHEQDGVGVDDAESAPGPAGAQLVIDARVGLGQVNVVGPDGSLHASDWRRR